MPTPDHAGSLEEQIDQWRSYLRRRQAIHSVDVAELEDHLREQVAGLVDAGLATDEAFLVAVKRMGDLDALSREFAREHSERLWKQLVVVPPDSGEPRARRERTPSSPSLSRWRRPWSSRCRRSSGSTLDAERRLLRPQREPLRAAPADRLFRLETAARHQHSPLAGRGVRRGGRLRQRLSLRPGRLHRGAHGAAPADRALAGRWASRTRAAAGARWPAAWTSFDSRASSSSTTC